MFAGLDAIRVSPCRRWTAMLAFSAQTGIIAVALIIPLLRPPHLPEAFVRRPIFVPTSGGYVHPQARHTAGPSSARVHRTSLIVSSNFSFSFHPEQNLNLGIKEPQPPIFSFAPPAAGDGVSNSISNLLTRPVPSPTGVARPPRISVRMQGNLVRRVEPQYPAMAKLAGVQGTVVMRALISHTGLIEQDEVISGPALLRPAALDAVRQWKYRRFPKP
jgi:periplasmic protein TonB